MKKRYLISIKTASKVLGVSRSSVYKLIDYDYIKTIRVLGRRMIVVQSVLEFINNNTD